MQPSQKSAQTLQQNLKISWVYAMAVGSAVGWGAFVLPYEWLSSSGLWAVITGFVIGTMLIAVIGLNYGYATRALPVTGGGIAFALARFGRVHGFIAGWSLMLGYVSIVSLNASAVPLVLRLIVPEVMMQLPLYSVSGWVIYAPEVAVSSLFLLAFAYLNVKNTALSGWVQFMAVVLMLLSVAVILFGTTSHYVNFGDTLALTTPQGVNFWAAVATIVAFAPWAYVGFDGIPQVAGEFFFDAKKITKLILASIFSAGFLYIALIVAASFALGGDLTKFAGNSWEIGSAIAQVMGKFGLSLMVLAVAAGVLTGLNGFYVAASRVVLTMGKSQMLPNAAAKLHERYRTPHLAIYAIMAVCLISPWFGRAALLWIVDMASVGIAITFFYACACSHKLATTGEIFGMKRQQPNQVQAWIGVLGMAIALGFLLLLFVPQSAAFLSLPARIALSVWAVVGVLFYFFKRRDIFSLSDEALRQVLFAKIL